MLPGVEDPIGARPTDATAAAAGGQCRAAVDLYIERMLGILGYRRIGRAFAIRSVVAIVALAVKLKGKNIAETTAMTLEAAQDYFKKIQFNKTETEIAKQAMKEIFDRLGFLNSVGVGYLTLDRIAGSLSGGEAQRIRLATQIGSALMGVLYVLDEPSIGLHQSDNAKLIATLKGLRDLGNTIVVVEHDEETMQEADYVVDMGPGAGRHGGQVVFAGTYKELKNAKNSLTADYLTGRKKIEIPRERRKPAKETIRISGAQENNLKNIDVELPRDKLVVITGLSGSGKSSLAFDTIYAEGQRRYVESLSAYARQFLELMQKPDVDFIEGLSPAVAIEQVHSNPNPRSTIAL